MQSESMYSVQDSSLDVVLLMTTVLHEDGAVLMPNPSLFSAISVLHPSSLVLMDHRYYCLHYCYNEP